jgi:hypothetical protein
MLLPLEGPHTPRRSAHPSKAVALLDTSDRRLLSWGPRRPQTPIRLCLITPAYLRSRLVASKVARSNRKHEPLRHSTSIIVARRGSLNLVDRDPDNVLLEISLTCGLQSG